MLERDSMNPTKIMAAKRTLHHTFYFNKYSEDQFAPSPLIKEIKYPVTDSKCTMMIACNTQITLSFDD